MKNKINVGDMVFTKNDDLVLILKIEKNKVFVDNNVNEYFIKLKDIKKDFFD